VPEKVRSGSGGLAGIVVFLQGHTVASIPFFLFCRSGFSLTTASNPALLSG
jgi:hypothetical protein